MRLRTEMLAPTGRASAAAGASARAFTCRTLGDRLDGDLQQVEIGRHRAALVAERVDIEHAAVARAGLARDLLGRRRSEIGAFAEHHRDLVLAHEVDDLAHLLRRALLVGVDRPEIELPSCRSRASR